MRNIAKVCVFAILIGVLLGGCGDKDTEVDKKIASLEQELEEERSKNAKEEKQSEQSSKVSESGDSSAGSSEESMSMPSESRELSADSSEDSMSISSEYADVNVGDTIMFGHYEQDNNTENGKEEIEWLVLAKEEHQMLVISRYVLDAGFDTEATMYLTWERSKLREWLQDFYVKAFKNKERLKIVTVTNSNPDSYALYNSDYMVKQYYGVNPYIEYGWGAEGGNDTKDKVFFLSYEEALSYFASDDARKCTPTAYAMEQGVYGQYTDNDTISGCWWLRSPGACQTRSLYIDYEGKLGSDSSDSFACYGLRPALWISISENVSKVRAKDPDADALSRQFLPSREKTEIKDAQVGDTIMFGHYEQDNNTEDGPEEIEWTVLAKEEDKMLVISDYVLESMHYNETEEEVTWETCPLRKWLNDGFYNTAFNPLERSKIIPVTNSNPDTKWRIKGEIVITQGGNATRDYVFCLSDEEFDSYLTTRSERQALDTAYVSPQCLTSFEIDEGRGVTWWWLRSPGDSQFDGMRYDPFDDGFRSGIHDSRTGSLEEGVRPALWIITK